MKDIKYEISLFSALVKINEKNKSDFFNLNNWQFGYRKNILLMKKFKCEKTYI